MNLLSFYKKRLALKILVPLMCLVIIVIGVMIYLNYTNQVKAIDRQAIYQVETLVKFIDNTIKDALAIGNNEEVVRQFQRVKEQNPGIEINVSDSSKRVVFASDKNRVGQSLNELPAGHEFRAGVDAALKKGKADFYSFKASLKGKPYLTLYRPILNAKRCFHCHGRSRKVLGGLMVRVAMNRSMKAILAARRTNMILGVLGIFVLGGVSFLIIMWQVSSPIGKIERILKMFAAGNYDQKISVRGKDEIGRMAVSLKEMLDGVIGRGESVIHGIPDPFVMTDNNKLILYMNEACEALTGFSKEETEGKLKGPQIFNSQGLPHCEVCDTLVESEKAGTAITGKKITMQNREGREIPLMVSVTPLRNLDGGMMGGMVILRDITTDVRQREAIERNQQILLEVARDVTEIAGQVEAAAELLSASSAQVAAGAEEQSTQANQVAAAVEEMSTTISEVAKHAAEVSETSSSAKEAGLQGEQVVNQTVERINILARTSEDVASAIDALSVKSREIGKIIEVISDIADQTNLLALNATIEAASAGEAGKGFAVVAGEVKELAKQTADSTENVGRVIIDIQNEVKHSVESMEEALAQVKEATGLANKAGGSLAEIVSRVDEVVKMVSGIAAAAEQQSVAVNEISQNVEGISSVSSETAQSTEETANAVKELAGLAESLVAAAKRFET